MAALEYVRSLACWAEFSTFVFLFQQATGQNDMNVHDGHGAMWLPSIKRSVYGVLSGNAFNSFGDLRVSGPLKLPCIVVVTMSRLKPYIPDTGGVRDIDRLSRLHDWLKCKDTVHVPVLRAVSPESRNLAILDGTHTLAALEQCGCEHICVAVPVSQAKFFAENYNP